MRTNLQIATELLASVLDGEGVTIDRYNDAAPTSGYVVGVEGISGELDSAGPTFDELLAWVTSLEDTQYFYGAWRDAETGRVYYDAVEIYEDLQPALAAAMTREEIAIWDLGNSVEIRVEYSGYVEYRKQFPVVEQTAQGPDYSVMITDADVSDDVDPDWPNEYI